MICLSFKALQSSFSKRQFPAVSQQIERLFREVESDALHGEFMRVP